MGDTKIEWAEKVWNPVTGCTKISSGCKNCYAARMANRLAGRCGYPHMDKGFRVSWHTERLEEPINWKKPSRIFVCSMGDLFHVNVPFAFVDKVIDTIDKCPQHTFLILTKRPHFMKEYFEQIGLRNNIWLGTSIEDQKTADERIPWLLQSPAIKRFISYEPAISPVDFTHYLFEPIPEKLADDMTHWELEPTKYLHWIIMGGESGPGARPMHPDWARSVRDQCQAAGVPFFFKQWGEWAPRSQVSKECIKTFWDTHQHNTGPWGVIDKKGYYSRNATPWNGHDDDGTGEAVTLRVGKKAAGCLLDGKEHKERP